MSIIPIKNLERLKAAFKQALLPLSHSQHPSGDRVHAKLLVLNYRPDKLLYFTLCKR